MRLGLAVLSSLVKTEVYGLKVLILDLDIWRSIFYGVVGRLRNLLPTVLLSRIRSIIKLFIDIMDLILGLLIRLITVFSTLLLLITTIYINMSIPFLIFILIWLLYHLAAVIMKGHLFYF